MSTSDTSTSAPGVPTAPDTGLPIRAVASAFATPILFMLVLAATLVTAFHSPAPHSMALTVAGPGSITAPLIAGLEQSAPGSFDLTQADDAGVARTAVENRDAVGAIVIGAATADGAPPTVTTYVASGGGRAASSAVEGVGAQIAAQMGATGEVVDVAPLVPQDALGSGIFYILIYSTIGGFLALIVLTQLSAGVSLRRQLGVAAATAVLVPTTVFALSSIFLDGFGLDLDQILAFLAVMTIYVFIVTLVVVASHQLLGKASVLAVVPLTVFINFASAGGGVPESMLPAFWQAVHSVWFGSGAIEAGRAIVYFPDAEPTRWILQMLAWVIALLAVVLLLDRRNGAQEPHDAISTQEETSSAAKNLGAQPLSDHSNQALAPTSADRFDVDRASASLQR